MTRLPQPSVGPAHSIIEEEALALRDFLELLKYEERALVDADALALQSLAAAKSATVARLNDIGLRRKKLVAQAGVLPTAKGIASWLESQPHAAQLRQTWTKVLEAASAARELNRTNGLLIKTRLRETQQALDILLAGGSSGTLYGPDGQTQASAARRSLVSA